MTFNHWKSDTRYMFQAVTKGILNWDSKLEEK